MSRQTGNTGGFANDFWVQLDVFLIVVGDILPLVVAAKIASAL